MLVNIWPNEKVHNSLDNPFLFLKITILFKEVMETIETVMVTNSTNINKWNNHLSSQHIEHNVPEE